MAVVLTILLVAVSGRISGMPADVDRPQQSATAVAQPAVVAAAVAVAVVEPAPPQTGLGSIAGRVIDKDGGVIPGATVTVSSPAMPVARTATTNSLGRFLVGNLSPDSYELTITQQGFRTLRVFSVVVSATESPTFTLRLDLGALTETVEVRGSAAAVSAAGVAAGQTSPRARQVAEYFDAAKYYYEQGRLSEAESMMVRALDELRASMSQAAVTIGPIAEPQGPIRAGGEINLPKLLFRLEPAYPADALAAGVQGMVYIDAVLAKDGTVKDARVISGHPMLTDAALAAVHQWRYTPTKLNGVPVEVVMTVFVNFRRR